LATPNIPGIIVQLSYSHVHLLGTTPVAGLVSVEQLGKPIICYMYMVVIYVMSTLRATTDSTDLMLDNVELNLYFS
jgi:hypothetical protein